MPLHLPHGVTGLSLRQKLFLVPTVQLTCLLRWWGDSPNDVPANEWIPCTTEPGGEVASDISYQIYTKPFYIGDFSFGVRQNFTETRFVPDDPELSSELIY